MTAISEERLVIVDASVVAMWVLPEPHSSLALALATDWARAEVQAIAPPLMMAEVASALYKRVRRGEMTLEQALEALEVIQSLGVRPEGEPELAQQALALAHRLNRPSPYDAHYLALADLRGCDTVSP